MNAALGELTPGRPDSRLSGIVKLAIFAVGGQGGGVLNGWIVDLAERNGFDVQATSVAGVAQRTGATIYYIEMLPRSGRAPVFALAPAEGDVDILLAAELMEAGRAVMRGFVTPDRTRVIASSHRALATVEKMVPGNGAGDGQAVMRALRDQAAGVVAFDMQAIAEEAGTVISSALFGALAGSGHLPFEVESFRDTVRASGRGVEASLAAFERACAEAQGAAGAGGEAQAGEEAEEPAGAERPRGPERLLAEYTAQEGRIAELPEPVRATVAAGLRKLVRFQDPAYGAEYLDRLEVLARADHDAGGAAHDFAFTATAAKYLANAMAYDDIIRVADAKTRVGRFDRIRSEVDAPPRALTRVTEYTHPGSAEVVSLMPAGLGRRVEARPGLVRFIDRLVNRGRHIRSDRIGGFVSLYMLAGLRRWRRGLLRHGREMAHIESWLDTAQGRVSRDYALAVETLRARRLIKGYSDTHIRGLSKFDRVMAGIAMVEHRDDAAEWARRLIDAALADEKGEALDGARKTIESFA